jgi:hypothetical protein
MIVGVKVGTDVAGAASAGIFVGAVLAEAQWVAFVRVYPA